MGSRRSDAAGSSERYFQNSDEILHRTAMPVDGRVLESAGQLVPEGIEGRVVSRLGVDDRAPDGRRLKSDGYCGCQTVAELHKRRDSAHQRRRLARKATCTMS